MDKVTELTARVGVLELQIKELVTKIEKLEGVYDVGGVVVAGTPKYVREYLTAQERDDK